MRTFRQLYHYLRWAKPRLFSRCCVYFVDRHTGNLQERVLSQWTWDTLQEDWIPEHRVERVMANGTLLWDKRLKVDILRHV